MFTKILDSELKSYFREQSTIERHKIWLSNKLQKIFLKKGEKFSDSFSKNDGYVEKNSMFRLNLMQPSKCSHKPVRDSVLE